MRKNNDDFIADLYAASYPRLLIYAQVILNDKGVAKEIVQDTFLEAFQYKNLPRHPEPKMWLLSTLKSKLRLYLQTRSRELLDAVSLECAMRGAEAGPADAPTQAGSLGDSLSQIRELLEEDEFHAFRRIVLEQTSHQQVAQEPQITEADSRRLFSQARQKLREAMPAYFQNE